jgi:hypothetical protein
VSSGLAKSNKVVKQEVLKGTRNARPGERHTQRGTQGTPNQYEEHKTRRTAHTKGHTRNIRLGERHTQRGKETAQYEEKIEREQIFSKY